jgi:hypothetical protein
VEGRWKKLRTGNPKDRCSCHGLGYAHVQTHAHAKSCTNSCTLTNVLFGYILLPKCGASSRGAATASTAPKVRYYPRYPVP